MEDLIKNIEENMPVGYAYEIYSSNLKTHVKILKNGTAQFNQPQDSFYWAVVFVAAYFNTLKEGANG